MRDLAVQAAGLAFTGQRRGEIAALHSDWIDRKALTITFPKQITKNGQEHVLPVTPYVLELLPKVEGLFFPARGHINRAYNGWSKGMHDLRNDCDINDFTLHDLRRTAATIMAEQGVAPHIIEKILNHVTGSTALSITTIGRIYNRARYLPEMRQALLAYEQLLLGLLESPAIAA